jgi:acetolactate synthase-1/2/3 large subunit
VEVKKALELIALSERPLLLLGGGVRTSGAAAQVLAFAERLQVPVVVSLMGKDAFPHDHPLFTGFIGSYGNRYANLALANCDLIVALGSRMDSRQTGNPKTFARAAKVIHVDIDDNELNNTVKATLAIHAHLSGFLTSALAASAQAASGRSAAWKKYLVEVTAEFRIEESGHDALVNPKEFLRRLAVLARGDEVFTADVGNHQMWAAQELRIQKGQRFLSSGGLGTMGFAIPAAIGAWFACRPRPVVALVGDGGFQMSLPELETIVHNRLPIKIVVFNNNILGLMWHFQNENFVGGGHPATEEGYSCPDIQKIAAAYGMTSRRIADTAAIDEATAWLLQTDGPALLELAVDPSWAGYPKVKPGNPIEGQLPEIDKARLSKFMLIPELPKS